MLSEAAESFEQAHGSLSARAQLALSNLRRDATSEAEQQRMEQALAEIRAHRYTVQPLQTSKRGAPSLSKRPLQQYAMLEAGAGGVWQAVAKAEPEGPRPKDPKVIKVVGPWKLDASLWSPRRSWADCRSFYESAAFLRGCMLADWEMAQTGGGLARFVMRFHTAVSGEGEGEGEGGGKKAKGGVDAEAMMAAVVEELLAHADELYSVFDAYAMSGGGDFTQ